MQTTQSHHRFRTLLRVAISLVLLVIFAGALVRATGSGMGCPDWPFCYGLLIPPVSESQLPLGYQQTFAVQGHEAHFDAVQTWIEYSNRLLGALAGLAMLAVFGFSVVLFRRKLRFILFALAALFLLGLEGWLGARVVGTFLSPYAVNLHLLLALLIVALLVLFDHLLGLEPGMTAEPAGQLRLNRQQFAALLLVLAATLLQMFLGVQVRVEMEGNLLNQPLANGLPELDVLFLHRISAVILTAAIGFFAVLALLRRESFPKTARLAAGLLTLLLAQIGVGLILDFAGMPAAAKPVHLLLATLLFGLETRILFRALSPVAVQ